MKKHDIDKWEVACSKANEEYSLDALDQYTESSLHKECLIAQGSANSCLAEIANLKRGKVTANFAFACCADCFADILSSKIEYTFSSFSAIDASEENELSIPQFPNKMPNIVTQGQLEKFLNKNGFNRVYTRHEPVWVDIKRRDSYLKTLRTLLETGAALAKQIGDEACSREFLNALRLTMKRSSSNIMDYSNDVNPVMTYDKAKSLYSVIESALSSLWVAVEYRKLKPLALRRRKVR